MKKKKQIDSYEILSSIICGAGGGASIGSLFGFYYTFIGAILGFMIVFYDYYIEK